MKGIYDFKLRPSIKKRCGGLDERALKGLFFFKDGSRMQKLPEKKKRPLLDRKKWTFPKINNSGEIFPYIAEPTPYSKKKKENKKRT